MAKLNTNTLQT